MQSFRNLADGEIALPGHGLVLVGPNGHGKTSFLEALLYLEVFRSFRGARERELVRFGADGFRVEAEVESTRADAAAPRRTVAAGFDARTRTKRVSVDGLVAGKLAEAIGHVRGVVLIGIGMAISTLVGQGQGMQRPDLGQQATWRGLLVSQVWMFGCAALFVLLPRPLLAVFHDQSGPDAAAWARTVEMGVVLLRFVAAYCLVDAVNVVVVSALQGAGDTTWTLVASSLLYAVFLAVLWALQRGGAGLYALWTMAALFVLGLAVVMLARFHSGRWKEMTVVEPPVA